jgi:hypothetical protein
MARCRGLSGGATGVTSVLRPRFQPKLQIGSSSGQHPNSSVQLAVGLVPQLPRDIGNLNRLLRSTLQAVGDFGGCRHRPGPGEQAILTRLASTTSAKRSIFGVVRLDLAELGTKCFQQQTTLWPSAWIGAAPSGPPCPSVPALFRGGC